MQPHDVFAYGVIASSTLYLLADSYPVRAGYAEIAEKHSNVGGEAANSALVLARLGVPVKLDGNWINPDQDADFLRDTFAKNGVDIARISFRACRGPKEMLVVDSDSRTIFGTYAGLHAEQSWNLPERSDVQNAKVVCLDPFFGAASRQVADYAQAMGKPVVTVDCKFDDPIALAADTAIISEEYLGHTYPGQSVASVMHEYRERCNGTLIFTFGHKEIVYGSREAGYQTFTPFQIDPVDTTGAGDSFRAGIVFGLLQGWPIRKRVEFASALAALVCRSFPGVLNSPSYDEVLSFLEEHRSEG